MGMCEPGWDWIGLGWDSLIQYDMPRADRLAGEDWGGGGGEGGWDHRWDISKIFNLLQTAD